MSFAMLDGVNNLVHVETRPRASPPAFAYLRPVTAVLAKLLSKEAKDLNMDTTRIAKMIWIVVLTLLSGYTDSIGFVHSAKVWASGRLVWEEVAKSGAGYALGAVTYWWVIKYLNEFGIVSPEIQTLGWFVVTIAGVALLSGDFFSWPLADRGVALGILLGLGWLVVRSHGG